MKVGAAEAARAIEPLCMLWCIPGFRENDWVHASCRGSERMTCASPRGRGRGG